MLEFEDAYKLVKDSTDRLDAVRADSASAIGMVLAEDVSSDMDMPPFDKSLRDGYAVRASDIRSLPAVLRVVGEVRVGKGFSGTIGEGEAAGIMTGAPVPRGADAVVMVEDTEEGGDSAVRIKEGAKIDNFISKRGSDIRSGEKVLCEGTLVREAELAVLATVGASAVRVYRRPSVAVLVTGDELVAIGGRPSGFEIRDSNGPLLEAMIKKDGFPVSNLGLVADESAELRRAIEEGLENDVLLVSGGVSAGRYDYVPEVLESIGVERVFHRVRIKPGKPLYFGKKGRRIVFGLPGNPLGTFVGYKIFVRLALRRMMGVSSGDFCTETGLLLEPIIEKSDRKTFVPVVATKADGEWMLKPAGWHGSADVFALARSNAFAIIPGNVAEARSGDRVEFLRW